LGARGKVSRKRHTNARDQYKRAVALKNQKWGSEQTHEWARAMKNAPTSAEEIMREWLRGNLTGVHFRRQAVVADYIVDFYCGLVRIAVEVDGNTHDPIKDRERDEHLGEVGVLTIRIPARKVYREIGVVFEDIRSQIFEILARDEWRRKRYLEHYKARWYWRKKNKNLAVWELYDKLAAL
jgi:very-short-patch-repair endonuclease